MRTQQQLFSRYLEDLPAGQVEWIGVRPARLEAMHSLEQVDALAERGLAGDRRCHATPGSGRQVTFISREHIEVVRQLLKRPQLGPELLRRNVMVSGINLSVLRHQHFRIGDALFYGTSPCHPCVRMDKVLGPGGAAAMMGHGGLCAKIIESGSIKIGDALEPLLTGD